MRNISAGISPSGQILICGDVVAGSRAKGFLVIAYGSKQAHYNVTDHYDHNQRSGCVLLTGLSGGRYSYSVFTVNEKGLPISKSAVELQHFSLNGGVTSEGVTSEGIKCYYNVES